MSVKIFFKKIFSLFRKASDKNVFVNVSVLAPNEYLLGRVALITGGSSGIGLSIAKAYLNSGAKVIITGRNEEKLASALRDLQKIEKENVKSLLLDNQNIESFQSKFEEALSFFGSIDILVNNAGILGGDISNVTEDEYDSIMNTNLKGPVYLTRIVTNYMIQQKIQGNILNICSSSSYRPANSAYHFSKWGMRGYTLGLAKRFVKYGIVVNGIAPGPTATPMLMKGKDSCGNISLPSNPSGRYALPEEVSNMAVFLVSGMARMVVGDIVCITGGAGTLTFDDVIC